MTVHYKEEIVPEEVQLYPSEMECDKCHNQFRYPTEDDAGEPMELQEFHRINLMGGYGYVFGDCTQVEADICQHCLLELIGDFCRYTNHF